MVSTEHTLTRDETKADVIPPYDGWIRFEADAAARAATEGALTCGPHVPEESADPEPHIIRSVN